MSFAVDQIINEGTQWEYSVSVPIRQLINNNQWTPENISEYVFAGLTDTRVNYIANVEDPDLIDTQTKNRTYNGKYNQTTFLDWSENVPNEISHVNGSELSEFTFYQRNVLVAPATPGSTALGLDSLRLVLDIKDIKNWIMDFDTDPVHSLVTLTSANGQTGNGYSGTAYHWGSSATIGPTITTRQTTGDLITKGLHVATITIINDELWFGYLNPSNNHNEFYQNQGFSRRLYNIYGHSSQTNQYRSGKRGMWTQSTAKYSMYPSWTSPVFPPSSDIGVSSVDKLYYNVNSNGVVIDCAYKYNDAYDGVALTSCSTASGYLAKDYNTLLTWLSWCGLYFRIDGITYKPIISGGVITGYTSDMSKPSEFDKLSNVTGNNVPSTPPAPTPGDDDDIDDLTFGSYSGGAGAFASVWYTTATELGNLKSWMNKAPGDGGPPSGYNPMDSILSLMIYPIAIPTQGSLVNISFFNANDPDNHLISSDARGYFTEGKTFEIDLGSYTIDPHHDADWAYLDYDTAVELYIPFCGIYQLDTQVIMGATLNAKMWVDPVIGSCTFCAYANNIPVAMGSGSMGVSLPIASQQFSMVQAAITTNRNSFIASAIGTAIGAITSVVTGGISGSAAAVNKTWGSAQLSRGIAQRPLGAQAVSAVRSAGFREGVRDSLNGSIGTPVSAGMIGKATGNVYNTFRTNKMLAAGNSTAVSGGFGGSQDPWRLPMTPYVKILRERTHVSDMHVGTTGKLYVMGAKLNDCSGFTTVINPDLSSLTDILTQSELAEIYTTLSNGVYC